MPGGRGASEVDCLESNSWTRFSPRSRAPRLTQGGGDGAREGLSLVTATRRKESGAAGAGRGGAVRERGGNWREGGSGVKVSGPFLPTMISGLKDNKRGGRKQQAGRACGAGGKGGKKPGSGCEREAAEGQGRERRRLTSCPHLSGRALTPAPLPEVEGTRQRVGSRERRLSYRSPLRSPLAGSRPRTSCARPRPLPLSQR